MGAALSNPALRRTLLGTVAAAAVAFLIRSRKQLQDQQEEQEAAPVLLSHQPSPPQMTQQSKAQQKSHAVPPPPSRPPPRLDEPPVEAVPAKPSRLPPKAQTTWQEDAKLEELWICMDFEWTCDEGDNRRVNPKEAEIIEFSYVIFDSVKGCKVCEGQHFCKNSRTPITQFCSWLTGITQAKLDSAGTLADALAALEANLSTPELKGRSCIAITHGPADLELALENHARVDNIQVPRYLRRYVDLREAVQQMLMDRGRRSVKAISLRDINAALEVESLGTEHCGLDDSWQVLMCFQQLVKRGVNFEVVDMDEEERVFPLSPEQDRWLCLDGVTFYTTIEFYQEWIEAECGMAPGDGGVLAVLAADGSPSGKAIVDFGSPEAALRVLKATQGGATMVIYKNDNRPGARKSVIKERLILVRPLRRQERRLITAGVSAADLASRAPRIMPGTTSPTGPGLAAIPTETEVQHALANRPNNTSKGKGKGAPRFCWQGADCTRPNCTFFHPPKGQAPGTST